MNNDGQQVAESSAAETTQMVPLQEYTREQRDTFFKDGTLVERKIETKKEESSTSKPGDATDDKGADAKKAESGTADKKAKTEERFQELLKERKEARDKADRLEAELAEMKKTPKDEKKTESSTVPAEVKEPDAPERPKRPKRADFADDNAYESAMDKHEEAMLEYPGKKAAYDSAKAQADRAKSEIETHNKKMEESWKTRLTAARTEFADFDAVALDKSLPIPWGSPVDEWILQSDVGAKMLYHLGKNREELTRINALSRPAQHREMAKLEETLSGAQKSEETPKKETPQVTAAKKPPSEVGGKGTSPEDEVDASVKNKDVRAYMNAANKRDLASRKGK